jgi:hypothetical protein
LPFFGLGCFILVPLISARASISGLQGVGFASSHLPAYSGAPQSAPQSADAGIVTEIRGRLGGQVKERTLPGDLVMADGYTNGGPPGMMPGGPMGMPVPGPPPGPLLNGSHLRVLPETERQVLEREIGSLLMPMTQDGSPCVRSEVAVALARLAAAHSVYFEVPPLTFGGLCTPRTALGFGLVV